MNFSGIKGLKEISEAGEGFLAKIERNEAEILPEFLHDFNKGMSIVKSEIRLDETTIEKFLHFFNRRKEGILKRFSAMGKKGLKSVFTKGMRWAVDTALGTQVDMSVSEHNGVFPFADPSTVGYDDFEKALNFMNDFEDVKMDFYSLMDGFAVTILCSGSSFSEEMISHLKRVPYQSDEGRSAYGLLGCLANYAWARRQVITGLTKMAVQDAFGRAVNVVKMVDVSFNLVFDDGEFFSYKHEFPFYEDVSLQRVSEGLILKKGEEVHRMVRLDV